MKGRMIHLSLIVLAFVLCACQKSIAPDEPWVVEGTGDRTIRVPDGVILVDISATSSARGTVQLEVLCRPSLGDNLWFPEATFVLGTAEGLSTTGTSRENISDCVELSLETTPDDLDEISWKIEKVQ